jgi:hypothetical protein
VGVVDEGATGSVFFLVQGTSRGPGSGEALAQERQDVAGFRIVAQHRLREDEIPVQVDVEDAARPGDDLDRVEHCFPFLQDPRDQTGRVRERASGDAVLDPDTMSRGHRSNRSFAGTLFRRRGHQSGRRRRGDVPEVVPTQPRQARRLRARVDRPACPGTWWHRQSGQLLLKHSTVSGTPQAVGRRHLQPRHAHPQPQHRELGTDLSAPDRISEGGSGAETPLPQQEQLPSQTSRSRVARPTSNRSWAAR